ncbi:MAG: cytochrome c3 family protein [Desulfocurvibacter africanus]
MERRFKLSLTTLTTLAALLALAATLWAQGIPSQVTITAPEGVKPRSTWIKKVQFDHETHSGVTECRTCHHMEDASTNQESFVACRECHAETKGNDPSGFYMAWHGKTDASCVTCHRNNDMSVSCTTTCHPYQKQAKKAGAKK